MTSAEEHIQKAMDSLLKQDYYEAMTNFTAAYNLTGNVNPLMMSAEASLKHAMGRLSDEDFRNWDTFSRNAISHFETCVKYAESDEIRRLAQNRINEINEFRQKVETVKKNLKVNKPSMLAYNISKPRIP